MSTTAEKWQEAKRRCCLSDDDIRKPKELGMQPLALIKNIPSPTDQWKAPVAEWQSCRYTGRRPAASQRFRLR